MEYLLWLAITIWLPAIVLWAFVRKPRVAKLKSATKLACFVMVTQLPVEFLILRYPMTMSEGHYLGLRLATYPIEDILFFLTVPFLVFALVHVVEQVLAPKC